VPFVHHLDLSPSPSLPTHHHHLVSPLIVVNILLALIATAQLDARRFLLSLSPGLNYGRAPSRAGDNKRRHLVLSPRSHHTASTTTTH
jgi:hypothetical protein